MFSISFRGIEAAVLCIKPTEFGSNFESNETDNIYEKSNGNRKSNDYSLFDEIRMTENRRTFFPYLLVKKKIPNQISDNYPVPDNMILRGEEYRRKYDMTTIFFPTARIEVLLKERTSRTDNATQFNKNISSCFDLENVLVGIKKCFAEDALITISDRENENRNSKILNDRKNDFFLSTTAMRNRCTSHYILDDIVRTGTRTRTSQLLRQKPRIMIVFVLIQK